MKERFFETEQTICKAQAAMREALALHPHLAAKLEIPAAARSGLYKQWLGQKATAVEYHSETELEPATSDGFKAVEPRVRQAPSDHSERAPFSASPDAASSSFLRAPARELAGGPLPDRSSRFPRLSTVAELSRNWSPQDVGALPLVEPTGQTPIETGSRRLPMIQSVSTSASPEEYTPTWAYRDGQQLILAFSTGSPPGSLPYPASSFGGASSFLPFEMNTAGRWEEPLSFGTASGAHDLRMGTSALSLGVSAFEFAPPIQAPPSGGGLGIASGGCTGLTFGAERGGFSGTSGMDVGGSFAGLRLGS